MAIAQVEFGGGGGRTLDNSELSQDRGFGEGAFEKKTQAMLKLWESCKVSSCPPNVYAEMLHSRTNYAVESSLNLHFEIVKSNLDSTPIFVSRHTFFSPFTTSLLTFPATGFIVVLIDKPKVMFKVTSAIIKKTRFSEFSKIDILVLIQKIRLNCTC